MKRPGVISEIDGEENDDEPPGGRDGEREGEREVG